MNKKVRLMQLVLVGLALWSGHSNGQQQYQTIFTFPQQQQQPQLFPQNAYRQENIYPNFGAPNAPAMSGLTQYKTARKQPTITSSSGTYEATEMSTDEVIPAVEPAILKNIANEVTTLWNIYDKAPRTANNTFRPQDWKVIDYRIDQLQTLIQLSKNIALQSDFNNFLSILDGADLFDKSIFGQALNAIIATVNRIIEINPNYYGPYKQQFALNDVPYLLMIEEPTGGIYSAQRTIAGTVYDWTKPVASAVGGAFSTGWDWTKWGASGIGSGLGSTRPYLLPTAEEVEEATKKLPLVKKELSRLQERKSLTAAEQTKLKTLLGLKSEYESKIRGWMPALAGAAAVGAGYLYLKSGK